MNRENIDPAPAADGFTTWHITWGTYGTRLHGGDRPTVTRSNSTCGDDFSEEDYDREKRERDRMKGQSIYLSNDQRCCVEENVPQLCDRGGWVCRQCAAQSDHIHILCDIPSDIHGKTVRRWLKTWITQMLNASFSMPDSQNWWADGGSTRAVKDTAYLCNVTEYVARQRSISH